MFKKVLFSVFSLIFASSSQAGLFDYSSGSYTSDMYFNVLNLGGNDVVEVNDVVRTVQRFTYLDRNLQTRTALAIGISKVTTEPTGPGSSVRSFLFGAPTAGTTSLQVDAISELTTAIGTALDSTGATGVSADTWALISTSGDVSLSAAGFDFTADNFGLTVGSWQVDATAAFSGTGTYQEYKSSFINATPSIDPVTYPDNVDVDNNDPTTFEQRFAYTYTGIYDPGSEYSTGDSLATVSLTTFGGAPILANVASTNDTLLRYVTATSLNEDFVAQGVAVTFAAPGAVPEPSSLAVMFGIGLAGVVTRRKRR